MLFRSGNDVFANCSGLTNITIPDSVTSLGLGAFMYCSGLKSVTFGRNLASIGPDAFYGCSGLVTVTMPNSVRNIGSGAFSSCAGLVSVFFQGNAPGVSPDTFSGDNQAIAYYLPGTTGWYSPFGGIPAMLWNPQVQSNGSSIGVLNNRFGFNITGTAGIPIVVESSTNPASGPWTVQQSCTLTNGSFYFCDSHWTNYSGRYYRFRSP